MTNEANVRRRGGPVTLFFLSLGIAIALFLLPFGFGVRFYRVPAGSMQPTLNVGDHIMVAKVLYGYGRYSFAPFPGPDGRFLARAPTRGDIAVFRPTSEPDRDFVKRVVGMPGDRIQMIDGVLHLNGMPVAREDLGERAFADEDGMTSQVRVYRETLPGGASYLTFDRGAHGDLDDTRVFTVPEGHYFMLGDDRDNSMDSRFGLMGYVPFTNLVGPVVWTIPTSPAERVN